MMVMLVVWCNVVSIGRGDFVRFVSSVIIAGVVLAAV